MLHSTGYWSKIKEKLKQKYPIITDNNLQFPEGKEKEMIELLGYKLGNSEQEQPFILQRFNRTSSVLYSG